jgi:hypothetical protein
MTVDRFSRRAETRPTRAKILQSIEDEFSNCGVSDRCRRGHHVGKLTHLDQLTI